MRIVGYCGFILFVAFCVHVGPCVLAADWCRRLLAHFCVLPAACLCVPFPYQMNSSHTVLFPEDTTAIEPLVNSYSKSKFATKRCRDPRGFLHLDSLPEPL
ncbi:hypothetical protein K438DRAFT_1136262 [Mycena galopus ATCC 62051]|nr:hypothetical protein K438DRAFT_1136262 [Mycena galopus ATCC 62051]